MILGIKLCKTENIWNAYVCSDFTVMESSCLYTCIFTNRLVKVLRLF